MSTAPPVVNIQNIDDIVRSTNNVCLDARLVWVDPAPTSNNAIRCTLSDHSRSIRLTLWGFDADIKKFLQQRMLAIFHWEGMNARANKETYLQREHMFGLSLNQDDKFNQKFVGRFHVIEGCTAPFLDVIVPQPHLMSHTPLPASTLPINIWGAGTSASPSSSQAPTAVVVQKREREDVIWNGWLRDLSSAYPLYVPSVVECTSFIHCEWKPSDHMHMYLIKYLNKVVVSEE